VSGIKRSGTSLMMQMLKKAGFAIIGEKIPTAWKSNSKLVALGRSGFYESGFAEVGVNNQSCSFNSKMHELSAVKVFTPALITTDTSYIKKVILMVRNWEDQILSLKRLRQILHEDKKINIDDLKHHIDIHANWYAARNYAQPHEVNEETYISNVDNIDQRVFQINCKDIPNTQFLDIFKNIMQCSGISDDWSTKNLQNVHQEYIAAQSNLQWFDSLQHWENTGQLCNYLTSHSVIESEVIRYILKKSNIPNYTYEDRARWLTFYSDVSGPDWPPAPASDSGIYDLPLWVQDEIKNKFNYQPMCNGLPIREIAE
jgi:hypothetical protein